MPVKRIPGKCLPTEEEIRQQAKDENVPISAIRLRVKRSGQLHVVREPKTHTDGIKYYTKAQIRTKARQEGVPVQTIKNRIKKYGSMIAHGPSPKDKALIEYIAARDGVSTATVRRRVELYGDPDASARWGNRMTVAQVRDASWMFENGVDVEVIAQKYRHTVRQILRWIGKEIGAKQMARIESRKRYQKRKAELKEKRDAEGGGKPNGRPKGAKDKAPRKPRPKHSEDTKELISKKKLLSGRIAKYKGYAARAAKAAVTRRMNQQLKKDEPK